MRKIYNHVVDRFLSLLPLIVLSSIIGFLPFVVYLKAVNYEGIAHEIYGSIQTTDFFTYFRGLWICILAGTGLTWFVINRKAQPNRFHIYLVAYCFFHIVSTVFAPHRELAIWGDPSRHEGLWIHLSYMIFTFLFINLITSVRELKCIVSVLAASSALLTVVGIMQFCGKDYFFGTFAQRYLIPQRLLDAGAGNIISSAVNQASAIFLTFGNSNFTGSYMTMLFAFSLSMVMLISSRWRYFVVPWNILLFVNLMGSKSRAGILGSLVATFILLLFLKPRLKDALKKAFLLFLAYSLVLGALEIYTVGSGRSGIIQSSVGRPAVTQSAFWGNFEDLELAKDEASVVFDGLKLRIGFNKKNEIEFRDADGKPVSYQLMSKSTVASRTKEITATSGTIKVTTVNSGLGMIELNKIAAGFNDLAISSPIVLSLKAPEGSLELKESEQHLVVFPDRKFGGYAILVQPSINMFKINRGGGDIFIVYTENGFKTLDHGGRVSDIKNAEAIGFKGRERFASGRGYIWSRTLPLLKQAVTIGFGPDTFAAHFPHYDCIERLKHWGSMQVIMEKPHNMYLQIAINSGLISLLFVLVMFAHYSWHCCQLYWNCEFNGFSQIAGLSIFMAVLAYLVAGIFNDSINSVAPVFWALLGTGIATNRINRQSRFGGFGGHLT